MKIIKLCKENKEIIDDLALYFHQKWKVEVTAYIESMNNSLDSNGIPSWYYVVDNNKIIAGVGVIENDFHKRKDLTPNICALYVNSEYRKNGLAKSLLNYVCSDLLKYNINNVYLITSHDKFYERCGFEYYGNIEENDGNSIRCYVRKID